MTQSPLRLLHVINSLDPREGGTVECVRQIGGAISQIGHTVEVAICQDSPNAPWLPTFPLRSHALGPGVGRYAFTPRLRDWLRSEGQKYDAWIVNGLWQYQGFAASRVALESGIPYFVYAHGMLDPWSRRANPMKYAKKFLYWLLVEKRTLQSANALVFTSVEEERLARSYFPVAGWRSLIVGNGIADPPQIEEGAIAAFRESRDIPVGKRVMLFLSRVHTKKGVDILLKAFAAAGAKSRYVLMVTGDGDPSYILALKSLARELGIADDIRWTGPLYGNEKWTALRTAELFVLPSHQENFGIVIAEALATGTPVCTTFAVNIHETVTDYGAGLICEDRVDALSKAMIQWMSLDKAALDRCKLGARRCFQEQFRVEAASNRLLSAVQQAVNKKRSISGVIA